MKLKFGDEELLSLHREGLSDSAIARKLNVCSSSIAYRRRKLRLPQNIPNPTRICELCGSPIKNRSVLAKYCSRQCGVKAWNRSNPARIKERYRRSYYKHRRERIETSSRCFADARRKWGIVGYQGHKSTLVKKAEQFVAKELTKFGFSDLLLTRCFSKVFPFDILAKNNGSTCAIDVTLTLCKNLKSRTQLAEYLGLQVYVCHVKPDFSRYYLKKLPKGKKFSSCRQDFLRDCQ